MFTCSTYKSGLRGVLRIVELVRYVFRHTNIGTGNGLARVMLSYIIVVEVCFNEQAVILQVLHVKI
jgi:hypothetical protein